MKQKYENKYFLFLRLPDVIDDFVETGIVRGIFEVVTVLITDRRSVVNRILILYYNII
jgi:hypothetical protein